MTKEELKKLREETGLSQEKFASEIGVSVAAVRAWEQGVNPIKPMSETAILKAHFDLTKK